MRYRVLVWLILAWPGLASAEFFICGNTVRPQCVDTVGLTNVIPSSDPTRVTDPLCVMVPTAQVEAQRTLIQTVIAAHPNGRCHLTRVGDLAAEMTQAEKDAVNLAFQQRADAKQALEDAITDSDCAAKLDELESKFATIRTNVHTAITANLAASPMNTPATIRAGTDAAIWGAVQTVLNIVEKLAKCERASRALLRGQ